MRVRAIRSCASFMSSGGSPIALSSITSTAVPPLPKTTIGPKVGSSAMPAISSRAFGRRIMGWIVTPVMRASGLAARARARISVVCLAHRLFAGQVETHAADVGLVHDIGRQDFDGDRAAAGEQGGGRRRGLIGVRAPGWRA